ncbi:Rpn family recombination-promoting nuclease/putative transposase [Thermodesulfobacteriota bacterium B35]
MADHDHSYKQLFSHPELVRDLLEGFVCEDWVADLALETLERVNGSYVSDDLRERENDIIWRVRMGGSWVYVYLLIEFQSSVDRFMALRLLTYVALLYQDLVNNGQVRGDGLLPPVLPLVLYNGRARWNAPVRLAGLIQDVPGSLGRYRPAFRYLLLDEQRFLDEHLPAGNLVSAIFRLEKSQYPEDVRAVVSNLITWLKQPQQAGIRRAFTVWINRVLLPVRLPGQELPQVNELMEIEAMLAERVKEWTREWKEQGLRMGREEGLQEGIQQGLQQGTRQILKRQLRKKFGSISPDIEDRIRQADEDQLLEWSDRILTAESLDEMFT